MKRLPERVWWWLAVFAVLIGIGFTWRTDVWVFHCLLETSGRADFRACMERARVIYFPATQ